MATITQNERMRRRRAEMTDEQRDAARAKARERMRRHRAAAAAATTGSTGAAAATSQERRQTSNARLVRLLGDTPLTDAAAVIAFLRATYTNPNTRRTYLANLIGEKRDDASFPAAALSAYRFEMLGLIRGIQEEYGNNTRSDRDLKGWVQWEDLVAARDRCDREGPLLDRAVLALYMDTPPRRGEYATLRVRRDFPPGGDAGNYVVLAADGPKGTCGTLDYVTLGTYKTAKKYGRQTIDGARFSPALAEYAATKSDGDWLWPHGYRSPSGWSKAVSTTSKKWAGTRATVNIFRKSFVSYLARTRPAMTTNQLEAVANDMGTSLAMLGRVYRKVL
jgi:hypothetical protein